MRDFQKLQARKKRIPSKVAGPAEDLIRLKRDEQQVLGIGASNEDEEVPYIALKYFDRKYECFSKWGPTELKAFSSLVDKLKKVNWQQLKTQEGLGYTVHPNRNRLPNGGAALEEISHEISPFEIRVTGKARLHGFRMKAAFFLVWLDKNHRIYPDR